VRVRLDLLPPKTTAQQKRAVVTPAGVRFYHSPGQVAAERSYLALLAPYAPAVPLTGPLTLAVRFTWPHLVSTPTRRRAATVPKTTRPDLDNLAKQITDCLVTLRYLEDDGQVAELTLGKYHGPPERVGIELSLEPLEAPTREAL